MVCLSFELRILACLGSYVIGVTTGVCEVITWRLCSASLSAFALCSILFTMFAVSLLICGCCLIDVGFIYFVCARLVVDCLIG